MSFDYEEYAKQIAGMDGGVYNRNRFRLGNYAFEVTRCEAKSTRKGVPMIALEGTISEVLRATDSSNSVGESVSFVSTRHQQYPEYFLKDQLAIAAAVMGVSANDLKNDTAAMVEALKAIFPPQGGEKSLAIGKTIQVSHRSWQKDDGTEKTGTFFDPM